MICPLMNRRFMAGNLIANGPEAVAECQKENCAFWIEIINPLTGITRKDCAEVIKAQALADIVIELRRRPTA